MADPVTLGPPECIFETDVRAAIVDFVKGLPGTPASKALDELRRR